MRAIILILIVSTFISCENSKKEVYTSKTELEKDYSLTSNEHPGKKLLEQNCYICHNPTTIEENRIAPPMIAIKKRYISSSTIKSEFKRILHEWIKNPNEKDAKMFGAVRRFGVMPKTPYPEETIDQIADYMFDHEIEQPTWFEDHYNREHGKGNGRRRALQKQLTYEERGLKYALATKAELGKKLMGTIQKKGTIEALEFCNEKAYPLTDSMSIVHNATIKRVSGKPRNKNNKASIKDLLYINTFKTIILNKKEPQPIIVETRDSVNFYYPITTNARCLQCHGRPQQEIQPKTLQTIKALYPEDNAVGYGIDEVRGIWSITFNKLN